MPTTTVEPTVTVEIRNRWTGAIMLREEVPESSTRRIRDALVQAMDRWRRGEGNKPNLRGADLRDANLRDADLRDADLRAADLRAADLRAANLRGADLRAADLRGADLRGAKDLRLPTGEMWTEYLSETVPALLSAGGKDMTEAAQHWTCHTWANCPMAWAFGVASEGETPLLLRPRVRQFVQFYDAKQIPAPRFDEVTGKWTCLPAGE